LGAINFENIYNLAVLQLGELWINKLISLRLCFMLVFRRTLFASLFEMFDENRQTSGRQILRQSVFFVTSTFGFAVSAHKLGLEELTRRLLTGRCRSSPLIYAPKRTSTEFSRVSRLTDKISTHVGRL
jgi:hypothetical protein